MDSAYFTEKFLDNFKRRFDELTIGHDVKPCIFKIPDVFRSVSVYSDAYTPYRVAIGPYHANNSDLKPMQQYKLKFLRELSYCDRHKCSIYNELTRDDVQLATTYYAGIEDINLESFAQMLIIDGSFVVCFLAGFALTAKCTLKSTLTTREIKEIMRDLLLLENQIPFFILVRLFKYLYPQNFSYIAYYALRRLIPIQRDNFFSRDEIRDITCHKKASITTLPDLGIDSRSKKCYTYQELKEIDETRASTSREHEIDLENSQREEIHLWHLQHLIMLCCLPIQDTKNSDKVEVLDPPVFSQPFKSVTELHQAGVQFTKSSTSNTTWMDRLVVKFEKGILEMPRLTLDEFSESFLRNIIAFEQYYLDTFQMTSYMYFMDHLIDTSTDVQILQESDIIENWLESKENVTNLFNSITKHTINHFDDNLHKVSIDMKNYVSRPCNRWMATLRRDYFGTPWAPISFIAAVVLLILTILQTLSGGRQISWKF